MELPDIDFNSLDIREIGSWPLILRLAVIVAASIISLIAMYFFILSDQITALQAAKQQVKTKRDDFKGKYNVSANLEAYQKQMVEIKASYAKLLQQIPATDQIPELIDDISRQAEKNGLKYKAIKPGTPKSILGFYKEMPIELLLNGTYNGFGGFVSDVSMITRIITFHDFSIIPIASNKTDSNVGSGQLAMSIAAKTYWLSSEPEKDEKTKSSPSTSNTPAANKPSDRPRGANPGSGSPRGPRMNKGAENAQ